MAKGYWVVNVDTSDPEAYKHYQAFAGPYVTAAGGRFLTRSGQRVVKEGNMRARTVVIEFPSFEAAVAAYDAEEYQLGRQRRAGISTADFVIIEGA